ncbi:hypothetical protein GBA52_024134 [Prunus armeniaca]|nr:hypothetical protein GBA52_024134 [Prunus armeniaca]
MCGGINSKEIIRGQNSDVFGGLYMKVKMEEQMQLLRWQTSVYTTICEQLDEMHKTDKEDLAGWNEVGKLYCNPSMASGGHKINSR